MPFIEVAISLALLYLFFSQVVLSGFELIAGRINLRGRFLRHQLNKALNSGNDKNWAEMMYRHPSVDMLAQTARRSPTYVPSSVFVKAIVDLVIDEARIHRFVPRQPSGTDSTAAPTGEYEYQVTDPAGTPLQKFEAGLAKVSPGDFKTLLQSLLLNARGCTPAGPQGNDDQIFAEFLRGLAVWYDNYMERVTGWYKREIRPYLFLLGLVLAIACNLDSLYVARYFWNHADERRQVADYATQVVQQELARQRAATPAARQSAATTAKPADTTRIGQQVRTFVQHADSLTQGLQARGFPIGWTVAARVDSTKLPKVFYAYYPAAYTPLTTGQHIWRWLRKKTGFDNPTPTLRPSYWVRYERQQKPAKSAAPSAVRILQQFWQRDTLLRAPRPLRACYYAPPRPLPPPPTCSNPSGLRLWAGCSRPRRLALGPRSGLSCSTVWSICATREYGRPRLPMLPRKNLPDLPDFLWVISITATPTFSTWTAPRSSFWTRTPGGGSAACCALFSAFPG
ncbi:hypothetical protein [Hymenobacter cellulosilyticus]|uniref:Uncharacterized protein n=1 Tax=Hymenobacter cellulosilyticus TaxID=2932248 RepID=A0A8T9QFF6_9BACT|nr:hypothetical protein [Hymenobacter cellulosilyticus]UOQ73563.1 hypothetical protein MUN79_06430 [Hymenobacter cellulosilyticus]